MAFFVANHLTMMMKILQPVSFLLLAFFLTLPAIAQEADSTSAWETTLVGKLSAAQAGFHNWAEGGINTVSGTISTEGKAARTEGRWSQTYDGRLAFGLVQQDTLDARKADDRIRLGAALEYAGDGFFSIFHPTLAATARTQFAPGFNYDKNPFANDESGDERKPPVRVSQFMAPATFTQSVGLTYEPVPWFMQRFGLSAKETVVTVEKFRPLYGLDPDQTVRPEIGLELWSELEKEIVENVLLKSKLGLFAAFNTPDSPDLIWENLIAMQVNDFLSVNFEFVSLYDKDISKEVQLKEVLSVGVSISLL